MKVGDLKPGDVLVGAQTIILVLNVVNGHFEMFDLENGNRWSTKSDVNNEVTGWEVFHGGEES